MVSMAALAGCGGGNAGGQAQSLADKTTQAAYNDNASGVTAHFDDALKGKVSRSKVGALSDRLHALGNYDGLTFISQDPTKNEYTYRANFTNGTANVVLRLDQNGQIGAYRVFVPK